MGEKSHEKKDKDKREESDFEKEASRRKNRSHANEAEDCKAKPIKDQYTEQTQNNQLTPFIHDGYWDVKNDFNSLLREDHLARLEFPKIWNNLGEPISYQKYNFEKDSDYQIVRRQQQQLYNIIQEGRYKDSSIVPNSSHEGRELQKFNDMKYPSGSIKNYHEPRETQYLKQQPINYLIEIAKLRSENHERSKQLRITTKQTDYNENYIESNAMAKTSEVFVKREDHKTKSIPLDEKDIQGEKNIKQIGEKQEVRMLESHPKPPEGFEEHLKERENITFEVKSEDLTKDEVARKPKLENTKSDENELTSACEDTDYQPQPTVQSEQGEIDMKFSEDAQVEQCSENTGNVKSFDTLDNQESFAKDPEVSIKGAEIDNKFSEDAQVEQRSENTGNAKSFNTLDDQESFAKDSKESKGTIEEEEIATKFSEDAQGEQCSENTGNAKSFNTLDDQESFVKDSKEPDNVLNEGSSDTEVSTPGFSHDILDVNQSSLNYAGLESDGLYMKPEKTVIAELGNTEAITPDFSSPSNRGLEKNKISSNNSSLESNGGLHEESRDSHQDKNHLNVDSDSEMAVNKTSLIPEGHTFAHSDECVDQVQSLDEDLESESSHSLSSHTYNSSDEDQTLESGAALKEDSKEKQKQTQSAVAIQKEIKIVVTDLSDKSYLEKLHVGESHFEFELNRFYNRLHAFEVKRPGSFDSICSEDSGMGRDDTKLSSFEEYEVAEAKIHPHQPKFCPDSLPDEGIDEPSSYSSLKKAASIKKYSESNVITDNKTTDIKTQLPLKEQHWKKDLLTNIHSKSSDKSSLYNTNHAQIHQKNENNSNIQTNVEPENFFISGQTLSVNFIKKLAEKINSQENYDLEFQDCDLTKELLSLLKNKLDIEGSQSKMVNLTLEYTDNVSNLFPEICEILIMFKPLKLSLEYDDLREKDMELFRDTLHAKSTGSKITELKTFNVSYNKNLGPEGFLHVGEIMHDQKISSLIAANCNIKDADIVLLRKGLDGTKIDGLDISGSKNMTSDGYAQLAEFAIASNVKSLNLSDCQLTTEKVEAFCTAMTKTSGKVSLEDIDFSYNHLIEPEAYKNIGSLVWKCGVKRLNLAGCSLDRTDLAKLREVKERKPMTSVDAADNVTIGRGIVEIAKIVNECQLEELILSDCMFSEGDLKAFKKALGDAKLKILDLSDFDRAPDMDHITYICELLPNVTDELRLQFKNLSKSCRELLQEKINELDAGTKLKIIVDEDGGCISWGKEKKLSENLKSGTCSKNMSSNMVKTTITREELLERDNIMESKSIVDKRWFYFQTGEMRRSSSKLQKRHSF